MISKQVLRTGNKPTPYQKSFELVTGTHTKKIREISIKNQRKKSREICRVVT